MKNILIFILIIIIGGVLRWHNLSPFKIYPDSYQNLLVAQNIMTYHNVLGYLGPQGMLYPDFFSWTRPVYALLIIITNFATHNTTFAAQGISFLAGVLAIPLSYFFIKSVFKALDTRGTLGTRDTFSLAGTALLAISFNHTIWSGFIMTETTGIVFMLLFLMTLGKYLKTKPEVIPDFITGVLFAFAILTRYEYTIIFLPVIFLVFRQSPKPVIRLLTISSGTIVVLSFILVQFFPLSSMFSVIISQVQDLIKILGLVIIFSFLLIFSVKIIPKNYRQLLTKNIPNLLIGIIWVIALLLIMIPAARDFASHDFLIITFSLLGLTLMTYKKELRDYVFFVLFSVVILGIFYCHTNPHMERYITHLIPFLLIPASYGVIQMIKRKQLVVQVILVLLVILQTTISFRGLRPSQDISWFRTSYEEKITGVLKNDIPKNDWLIVSEPEPYFYFLQKTTYSIADKYPFIFIAGGDDKQKIMIVEDMGMHMYFPNFTRFLETHLKSFETKRFFVHENFHIETKTKKEIYPVILYEITLGELESAINASDF